MKTLEHQNGISIEFDGNCLTITQYDGDDERATLNKIIVANQHIQLFLDLIKKEISGV